MSNKVWLLLPAVAEVSVAAGAVSGLAAAVAVRAAAMAAASSIGQWSQWSRPAWKASRLFLRKGASIMMLRYTDFIGPTVVLLLLLLLLLLL